MGCVFGKDNAEDSSRRSSTKEPVALEHVANLAPGIIFSSWVGMNKENQHFVVKTFSRVPSDESVMLKVKADIEAMLWCYQPTIVRPVNFVFRSDNTFDVWYNYYPHGAASRMIDKFRMKAIALVKILHDTASGMRYLHSCGMCHGHLTAENILRCENDFAISDCGVGAFIVALTANELYEAGYRSASIFPPEILENPSLRCTFSDVTKRDVWAFGCTAFRVAFGHQPFTGNTKEELFENIQTQGTSILLKEQASLHGDTLVPLLQQCLEPDPSQRSSMLGVLCHKYFTQRAKSEASIPSSSGLTDD